MASASIITLDEVKYPPHNGLYGVCSIQFKSIDGGHATSASILALNEEKYPTHATINYTGETWTLSFQ